MELTGPRQLEKLLKIMRIKMRKKKLTLNEEGTWNKWRRIEKRKK
jgi:hypothetical protein